MVTATRSYLRLRKNPDINAFRRFDQAIHRIARQRPPSRPLGVSDEDLRNPMFARKTDDLGYRIGSLQNMNFGAQLARQVQIGVQGLLVLAFQAGLRHVGDKKLSVKTVRVAAAAFDHGLGVAARSDTYQDTLLRAPGLMDAVHVHVALEL